MWGLDKKFIISLRSTPHGVYTHSRFHEPKNDDSKQLGSYLYSSLSAAARTACGGIRSTRIRPDFSQTVRLSLRKTMALSQSWSPPFSMSLSLLPAPYRSTVIPQACSFDTLQHPVSRSPSAAPDGFSHRETFSTRRPRRILLRVCPPLEALLYETLGRSV